MLPMMLDASVSRTATSRNAVRRLASLVVIPAAAAPPAPWFAGAIAFDLPALPA